MSDTLGSEEREGMEGYRSHSVKEHGMFNHEESSEDTVSLGQKLADAHDMLLSESKVRIVLFGMSLSVMIAFVDLNGLSIVLPYIAKDIGAELTISWAVTSQLIGMSLFQLLCGRLADIFGRKNLMVVSIITMGIFELACGLSRTDVQFFVFRGLSGVANGNISSLAMVVMSDIVPLHKRGTYQGYLTVSIGIGNSIGPFLASIFIHFSSWRKFFFTLFALSTSSSLVILWLVPKSKTTDVSLKEKLYTIDYAGFFFSAVSLVLILVPVNGGGLQFEWNSVKSIAMLVSGGVCGIVFIIIELKLAKLPIFPMAIFNQSFSLCLVLFQSFLFGLAYFSVFFYYGYYFEIVRGFTPIIASCFFLCIFIPHSLTSMLAGRFVTWIGHYNPVLHTGFTCWTVALSLLASVVHEKTPLYGVALLMVLTGIGQGLVFQNTLVAALAHSRQQDRAVVISTRQVLRYFGGGVGLAIASLIFSTSFIKFLSNDDFVNSSENTSLKAYLRSHVYSKINLDDSTWNTEQISYMRSLYMRCLRNVFIWWAPLVGSCLIISFMVKDRGLKVKNNNNADLEKRDQIEQDQQIEQEESETKSTESAHKKE